MTSHVQNLILIPLFLSALKIIVMSTIENTQMLYNALKKNKCLDAGNVFVNGHYLIFHKTKEAGSCCLFYAYS